MTDLLDVQLTVNGQMVRRTVPAGMTLMDFLRQSLGLMGVKNGCDSGHCGTCTVIFNGQAKRSCLIKMSRANGCTVETVESLAPTTRQLHPLQYAFAVENAIQCGFCTPGMLMAGRALLDHNPAPSEAEIRHALRHNLCRCTGYASIVRAVQRAAGMLSAGIQAVDFPTAAESGGENGLLGQDLLDKNALAAVRGEICYGTDLTVAGMLYGKIKWADLPSAKIVNIDDGEALRVPGVRMVLTGKDVLGTNRVGQLRRDQPGIVLNRVRSTGDIVAVVYAESETAAEQGIQALKVEYEPLPAVFTPQAAAAPDAPQVHESGNLCHSAFLKRGDAEAAFASAAVVAAGEFTTPFVDHAFLEPEAGVAYPAEDGGVVLEIGTQCPFDDRKQMAEALGFPVEKIRVRQLPMGGAFGGREDIGLHLVLVLGALVSGKPVKITLTREESLRGHPKRHPAWMRYKIAADAAGKLQAVQAEIDTDTGAYASLGIDILENMLTFGAGPYYVPNVDLVARAWYTNNLQAGAMRGFGVPQVAFAVEALIDEIARKLGQDPFEFRLNNALDVGLPLASDHVLEASVGIKATLTAARDALAQVDLSRDGKKIGVGVASSLKNIGFGHGAVEEAGALVELNLDGTFLVRVGLADFGQGAFTAMAQLAAHQLGARIDQVQVAYADTALSPETGATTASRQTYLSGNAVINACAKLKDEIIRLAEEELHLPASELTLQDGRLLHVPSERTFGLDGLGVHLTASGHFCAPKTDPFSNQPSQFESGGLRSRRTHFTYGYGTHVAVVEVDESTGKVKVHTVIAAHDVGRAINPAIIKGQIEGGVVMGMGYGLSEEFVIENGILRTDTLKKCGIPGFEESPQIVPIIVEDPDPYGPHGVKGMGEVSILPTAAAVANAIYDAVGVRITSLPAKPETVLAGLARRAETGGQA